MTVNYEELKRTAEAVLAGKDDQKVGIKEFFVIAEEFRGLSNPSAVLEMIKEREEMLVALQDIIDTYDENNKKPMRDQFWDVVVIAKNAIKQAKAGAV